jgi:hypothetical protein
LHVVQVTYLKDYTLRLVFNNGVTKDVDLQGELSGEIFVHRMHVREQRHLHGRGLALALGPLQQRAHRQRLAQ